MRGEATLPRPAGREEGGGAADGRLEDVEGHYQDGRFPTAGHACGKPPVGGPDAIPARAPTIVGGAGEERNRPATTCLSTVCRAWRPQITRL